MVYLATYGEGSRPQAYRQDLGTCMGLVGYLYWHSQITFPADESVGVNFNEMSIDVPNTVELSLNRIIPLGYTVDTDT